MKLQLLKALNRQHLRRKIAQERALLAQVQESNVTAAEFAQEKRHQIHALQAELDGTTYCRSDSSADIARRLDRNAKQWLFA